jgi:hypothetical protein
MNGRKLARAPVEKFAFAGLPKAHEQCWPRWSQILTFWRSFPYWDFWPGIVAIPFSSRIICGKVVQNLSASDDLRIHNDIVISPHPLFQFLKPGSNDALTSLSTDSPISIFRKQQPSPWNRRS